MMQVYPGFLSLIHYLKTTKYAVMAKIKIETKNRGWLKTFLGLSILLLFATSIGCKNKEEENKAETVTTDAVDVHENNSTVTEYITFVRSDKNKMTLDHAYTNETLLKLTSAISAMAGEVDFEIKGDLEKAKECANNITKNPFETSHADEIKKAAEILSGILQNIQVAKYPGLANETGELKIAAMAINPETLTLDQKDAVKSFFAKSANLLEKMN